MTRNPRPSPRPAAAARRPTAARDIRRPTSSALTRAGVEQQPDQPPGQISRGQRETRRPSVVQPALIGSLASASRSSAACTASMAAAWPVRRVVVQGRHRGRQARADPGDHRRRRPSPSRARVGAAHVAVARPRGPAPRRAAIRWVTSASSAARPVQPRAPRPGRRPRSASRHCSASAVRTSAGRSRRPRSTSLAGRGGTATVLHPCSPRSGDQVELGPPGQLPRSPGTSRCSWCGPAASSPHGTSSRASR